jgi:hypothetical protein
MLIRPATPADILSMAEVNVTTRRECYPGIFPAELLARASPERIAARWMKNLFTEPDPPGSFGLVAEQNARVVAFVIAGPARADSIGATGELYTLYVLPSFQHQGLGSALMSQAARFLQQDGLHSFYLWVLTANISGRAFYQAMGGLQAGQRFEDVKGYLLDETAYLWPDISRFLSSHPQK